MGSVKAMQASVNPWPASATPARSRTLLRSKLSSTATGEPGKIRHQLFEDGCPPPGSRQPPPRGRGTRVLPHAVGGQQTGRYHECCSSHRARKDRCACCRRCDRSVTHRHQSRASSVNFGDDSCFRCFCNAPLRDRCLAPVAADRRSAAEHSSAPSRCSTSMRTPARLQKALPGFHEFGVFSGSSMGAIRTARALGGRFPGGRPYADAIRRGE